MSEADLGPGLRGSPVFVCFFTIFYTVYNLTLWAREIFRKKREQENKLEWAFLI